MKRQGDDLYSRAQAKRPSYMQSQIGEGEGASQRLTTIDALTYLKDVRDMFQDQKEKYDQFLEVMKDFKAKRTDTTGVIQRVKELFKGHTNLILGFNTFLPKGFEITLGGKKTVEYEEAIGFVNKIKKRFQHDEHVYKSFLGILNMYRKEHKGIKDVNHEVSILFNDHPDLLDEFTRFLPDNSAAPSMLQEPNSLRSLPSFGARGPDVASLDKYHMDKHRRNKMLFPNADRNLSVDHPDLETDKASLKMFKGLRKHADKDARERRYRDHNDRELDHDRKPSRKGMYNQEFNFCDEVRERVTDPEYQIFLKCLNRYSKEIVSRTELLNLMSDLLGKYPKLVEGFNEFVERCENTDGFLAGVMNKYSKLLKLDDRAKGLKLETGTSKETDRYNEKYLAKSIQELDLANCERCTPSYRLLPEDYPIQRASQISKLGAQVLNDHWVSVTSGSEDYSFKHMRRNQYEESLFRCEDDRFELDMLIESVRSASSRVEELLTKLNDCALDVVLPLQLDEHFSVLNIRCIERLYGDHGLDAVDILRKNPFMALPVILLRLKQKREEWARCRSDFNKVWADIYSKNHYKSLDHRSFYFKQQDTKNLSSKSMVAEIKELKENKQKDDNVLLAIAAGNRQPIIPNLEFQYPDPDIHGSLYELVHYSCEQICSSEEQSSRVMQLWSTFLEPMLGIPARIDKGDSGEAIASNQDMNVETWLGGSEKPNKSLANYSAAIITGTSKPSSNGDENTLPEPLVALGADVKENGVAGFESVNKDCKTLESSKSKMTRSGLQVSPDQQSTKSGVTLPIATEIIPRKMSIGVTPDNESSMVGKEGDSEDDVPPSPLENHDVKIPHEEVGESMCSQGPVKENNADDECSENVSIAGEVSGSEPAGEDCSLEDHDEDNKVNHNEEDEAEHDEIDGKVESEGEAEGLHDTNSIGEDGAMPPMSEHLLLNIKPLAKYVSLEWHEKANENTHVFYGNNDYYVLLRLHQMLYKRILFARTNTVPAEVRLKSPADNDNLEPFKRFLKALHSLLDGSADNSKFEDDCRSLIGNRSYELFTLDKLIYKLVKQLQSVASDEMDIKLLQLYDYEKSRKSENHIDLVYHENARSLIHGDNVYRFEFNFSLPSLSIQLMDDEGGRPEVAAASIDPNFGDYLYNDYLAVVPSKREPSVVLLQRNKRLLCDRFYQASGTGMESMDTVKMENGLEYKIVCNSSKISYVLDTEDYLFRPKRKRKNVSAERAKCINQTRQERMHMMLHIFNNT